MLVYGPTRGNPGTTSYREPDVLNGNSFDKDATNLSKAGLGANITEAAMKLRDDYKSMMDSIKKYGGFYVGRYELSNSGTQKNQEPLTSINWYDLYAKCKTLSNNSVESRMIWGCQWDFMCNFIETCGDKANLTSKPYGNYSNSTVEGHGVKQVTGYSEYWKANNIYDIAGNCAEWTQEAYGNDARLTRGGSYKNKQYSAGGSGTFMTASRYDTLCYPYTDRYVGTGTRPSLYIK